MSIQEYVPSVSSSTASYSKSSSGMVDSTGMQMSNPFDNNTSVVKIFPIIYQLIWNFGEKQNEKHLFCFDWAGGLSELKGTINSVELSHEALKWR